MTPRTIKFEPELWAAIKSRAKELRYRRVFTTAVLAARLDPITWHGLRHTGASWLAMSGASDQDIASYLRHASTALVGRYAHLSPAYQQGLMERVSAFKTATYRPYGKNRGRRKEA